MKKVFLLSKVDEDKCVGDRFCVNVCPTRAIRMENKKAVVDEARCAGCLHCLDDIEDFYEYGIPIPKVEVSHLVAVQINVVD